MSAVADQIVSKEQPMDIQEVCDGLLQKVVVPPLATAGPMTYVQAAAGAVVPGPGQKLKDGLVVCSRCGNRAGEKNHNAENCRMIFYEGSWVGPSVLAKKLRKQEGGGSGSPVAFRSGHSHGKAQKAGSGPKSGGKRLTQAFSASTMTKEQLDSLQQDAAFQAAANHAFDSHESAFFYKGVAFRMDEDGAVNLYDCYSCVSVPVSAIQSSQSRTVTFAPQPVTLPCVLDSGAEDHMGPEASGPTVARTDVMIQGVGGVLNNVRTGKISLSTVTTSGRSYQLILPKALIHGSLNQILISYFRLLKEGYKVRLTPKGGTVTTPSGIVLRLHVVNNTWRFATVHAAKESACQQSDNAGLRRQHSWVCGIPTYNAFAALEVQDTPALDNPNDSDSPQVSEVSSEKDTPPEEKQDWAKRALEFHKENHHVGITRLLRIARNSAQPPALMKAIRLLQCSDCAIMAATRPSQVLAHPRREGDKGFAPGEFLHIDATGGCPAAGKQIDGAIDAFTITDDCSAVRRCYPTKSLSPEQLVLVLKRFQACSLVKIRRILTDEQFNTGAMVAWCDSEGIDLGSAPAREHASNGRAETTVNLVKTKARTFRQTSGATMAFHFLAMSWAATSSNFTPSSVDPAPPAQGHRTPAEIWPDFPGRYRDLEHSVPFGCRAYRYEGKGDYNYTRRARPCIFVGWSNREPAYLLFDLETRSLINGTYVKFHKHVFPMLDMMLAGEVPSSDQAIDVDGWRQNALQHIDSVSDEVLSQWCGNKQIILDCPSDFFPDEVPHIWTVRCIQSVPIGKFWDTKVQVINFSGPLSAIKDRATAKFHSIPTILQLSTSKIPTDKFDASIRRAIVYTYPEVKRLCDLAARSVARQYRPPQHPALGSVSQSDTSDTPLSPARTRPNFEASALTPTCTPVATPLRRSLRHRPVVSFRAGQRRNAVKCPLRGSHFISDEKPFLPASLREAKRHPSWSTWKESILKETEGLRQRGVYARVKRTELPPNTQLLSGMYVFSKPEAPKSRLVVLGHRQRPLPSRHDTFSSTPSLAVIRSICALANQNNAELDHIDISQAFSQSDAFPPDVHIYMAPPEFAESDPDYVWRLLRPLYGLAIAPRAWANTFRQFLSSDGWTAVSFEECVFTAPTAEGRSMTMSFHVDDILLSYSPSDLACASAFKRRLLQRFQGKDMGPVARYLGIDIQRDRSAGTLKLSQEETILDLLRRFDMLECNGAETPLPPKIHLTKEDCPSQPDAALGTKYRELVGVLQWLATCTRPDLAYAAQALARYNSNPGPSHWLAAKHTLRYLRKTCLEGLTYTIASRGSDTFNRLFGFCDSDWAADRDTRRSVGAFVLFLGGAPVSWRSKLQGSVALSTAEAEFMAGSATSCEVLWLRRILHDLGASQPNATPLYEDNAACVLLSENPVCRGRTKHIDMHVHALRDHVRNGLVKMVACPTFHMTADALTKALPAPLFVRHRDVMLGNTVHTAPSFMSVINAHLARVLQQADCGFTRLHSDFALRPFVFRCLSTGG
jgi:hypothetical protein